MSNSILLRSDTTFEPHLYEIKELPFIIHRNTHYIAGSGCHSNLHKNIEVLRFLKGRGTVICGEKTYPVTPGSIMVINSYIPHQVLAEEDLFLHCLIIGSEFSADNCIDVTLLDFDTMVQSPETEALFDAVMVAHEKQDALWQARVRCGVLKLLIHLCEKHAQARATAITEDHAFQIIIESINYIMENLQHKLSVEQIAAHAGFSKFYFLRLFKRVTGCTVIQYVNLLRCEYAKELLRTGKHTVKETALLCGFDNLSYFTSVFKKNTGCLPGAYKMQARK